jgi:hypothetical protein
LQNNLFLITISVLDVSLSSVQNVWTE